MEAVLNVLVGHRERNESSGRVLVPAAANVSESGTTRCERISWYHKIRSHSPCHIGFFFVQHSAQQLKYQGEQFSLVKYIAVRCGVAGLEIKRYPPSLSKNTLSSRDNRLLSLDTN